MLAANAAAAAGGILYFLGYIPNLFIRPRYNDLSVTMKGLAALNNNQAMAFSFYIIGKWEATGMYSSPISTSSS